MFSGSCSALGTVVARYEGRDNQLLLVQRFANLGRDVILWIIESALTFGRFSIEPLFADDGNQDLALSDSLCDDLRKFGAGRNGIEVAEDLFLAEVSGQTIIQPPRRRSAIVPPVTNENARHAPPSLTVFGANENGAFKSPFR